MSTETNSGTGTTGQAEDTPGPVPTVDVTQLDLGGDVLLITDRNGTILEVNDAFVTATGYSRREAIGSTPRMLSSGLQSQEFYADLWDTIISGQVWRGQLVDRRRDGTLRTYHSTITPVRDRTGKVTHFVAVERDLTNELQRIGALSSAGLLHTDRDGRCVYADPRAATILGRSTPELLGPGFLATIADDDRSEVLDMIDMATEHGRELRLDVRTRNGAWLHLELAPLTMPSGDVIGTAITAEDIGEQMAASRELSRRDAFVRSVLDALPDAVAIVDADGTVVALNQAWRERSHDLDDHPALSAEVGDNVKRAVRARATTAAGGAGPATGGAGAATGGSSEPTPRDLAGELVADLQRVLSGAAADRHRSSGVHITQLQWDEGGAVIRIEQ